MLIGTKSDMPTCVNAGSIEQFTQQHKLMYMNVSAATGEGVE
jgi:hypothetical protein